MLLCVVLERILCHEEGTYRESGISFAFAASTKGSEVRAMFEHAVLTFSKATAANSGLIAVRTPGRT